MSVEIFELVKVIYFTYIMAIPILASLWPMTVMPEIARKNFK